ncbi:uncharacterized protein [Coffea arabica]|uniref:Uncharacterized protein n=1 Tax=Coffea arabica TaxID=13443 RepID=A0ABM4WXC0_COFAR
MPIKLLFKASSLLVRVVERGFLQLNEAEPGLLEQELKVTACRVTSNVSAGCCSWGLSRFWLVFCKKGNAKRLLMARTGVASRGQKFRLLTNHFNVKVARNEGYFFHYSVYNLLYL